LFFPATFFSGAGFFVGITNETGGVMQLNVITNSDATARDKYTIARVIFATTGGATLRLVESIASMIANAARASGRAPVDVARDASLFECNDVASPCHSLLNVYADDARFQMCLRVTEKMLRGNLPDTCYGAVRFHPDNELPNWATARGYIADIDGILFYT